MFGSLTPLFTYIFGFITRYLNDSENYRNQTQYDDALITKSLVFQIFNNFTALFFVAFAKKPLFNDCIEGNCVRDIREMLVCIFIIRYILFVADFGFPFFKSLSDASNDKISQQVNVSVAEESEVEYDDPELKYFIDEFDKVEYPGPFNDYADTCIQFGYVSLFASVVPLVAILAIIENLLKIRFGAWKICSFCRRPLVELAEDVGMWSSLMDSMGQLGFVVSVAVIVFSSNSFDAYPTNQRILIFLVAEQALLIYKTILSTFLFSKPPEWIVNIQKRNEMIVDKYAKGIFEDDEEIDFDKGNLDDPVDIDKLTLYDMRKEKLNQEAYKKMESLEDQRRLLLRELRSIKEQLQETYKSETYNDSTGVGETKHGMSLGRLHVKLLELQQFMTEGPSREERPLDVKVRISIEWHSKRGSFAAGPPVGAHSFSKSAKVQEAGTAVFDQALGPFAPIRTIDADVLFDIIDSKPEMNNAVVGKAKISLRDLQEQQLVQKQLTIIISKSSDEDEATGVVKEEYAKLFVTLHFQFSKVLPLRTKIYHIQDSLRGIEKRLKLLKAGDVEGAEEG